MAGNPVGSKSRRMARQLATLRQVVGIARAMQRAEVAEGIAGVLEDSGSPEDLPDRRSSYSWYVEYEEHREALYALLDTIYAGEKG